MLSNYRVSAGLNNSHFCKIFTTIFRPFWAKSKTYTEYEKIRKSAVPELMPKCLAMVLEIQSTSTFNVRVEPRMVWMLLVCKTDEAAQSSGRAELDELGMEAVNVHTYLRPKCTLRPLCKILKYLRLFKALNWDCQILDFLRLFKTLQKPWISSCWELLFIPHNSS